MDLPAERLTWIENLERKVRTESLVRLDPLVRYFHFLQETILVALDNSGSPLEIATDKNNPLLLAYLTTTRSFSIAKGAMDLALNGHPFEAIALSRVIAEIAESTQYLVRHPNLIDRFISGSLKLDQVLKSAKKENPKEEPYPFGRLRGIQSTFAHASPDLLTMTVSIKGPLLSSSLVVETSDRIDEAAHVIVLILLMQYVVMRLTLLNVLKPLETLSKRDAVLHDLANIRAVVSSEGMSDAAIAAVREKLTGIS